MFAPAFLFIAVLGFAQRSTEALAAGTFDVQVTPNTSVSGAIGALTMTKTYHGDIEATSAGQMLGTGDPASGTASYVALEQLTGTVTGRRGSFVLEHSGWMDAGMQEMVVQIAPGSGTGELRGIRGTLNINIEGAVHRYVLHYTLAH